MSPTLISPVTEAVRDEVRAGQSRPLDALYPIVCGDARMGTRRANGPVQNRAVYVALGVSRTGPKEAPGWWSSAHAGAKFWLPVLTELQNRGLQAMFLAGVAGLQGVPPARQAGYPQTTVPLCIGHLVRGSVP